MLDTNARATSLNSKLNRRHVYWEIRSACCVPSSGRLSAAFLPIRQEGLFRTHYRVARQRRAAARQRRDNGEQRRASAHHLRSEQPRAATRQRRTCDASLKHAIITPVDAEIQSFLDLDDTLAAANIIKTSAVRDKARRLRRKLAITYRSIDGPSAHHGMGA